MNNEPLISVITITWNASDVIVPTLHSVASQTFTSMEHLIIDGASSDDTLSKAKRYGRYDIRIISEPDKGIYDAMNKGLRNARGRYVIFMNAGDSFHDKDTLSLYARATENSPDIIYGDTDIVNSDRQRISPRHLNAPEKLTFKSFAKGMLVCHQAFMVRKDIAPMYDTKYRFSADYEWTLKCIRAASPENCVNLHCVVADYLADGTTDKNMKKSLRERFIIMSEYYGLIPTVLRHIPFAIRFISRKIGLNRK